MNNLPNNWQVKSLGELFDIFPGGTPSRNVDEYWGGDIPWVKISDMLQSTITYTEENISEAGLSNSSAKIIPRGSLLISIFATVGRTAFLDIDAATNQAIVGLVAKEQNLDLNFVRYYLDFKIDKLKELSRGVAQNNINKSILSGVKIPLPPLPIQKQIAEILERADQAKQKRKEANKLTDEFLQSVFIEMFGDPVKNPKGWEKKKFGELGKLARGKSKHRPRNASFLLGGPYPLVQTGEIVNSAIYIKNYTQTYSEEGLKQSKIWPKGTLCISIAANIGYTAIMSFDACFPDSVVGFVPNEKVIVEYIHFYFRFIQNQLEEYAPQSAQKNINLEILNKLKIPVPPLLLQQQFAEIVNKTEALKEKQKQSEQELENLFQSLMQKAFKGELVLNSFRPLLSSG